MKEIITVFAVAACFAAVASEDANEIASPKSKCAAAVGIDPDYYRAVRPIGVNGQGEWNVRSTFFMYPPTFGFARHDGAVAYRFTVKRGEGDGVVGGSCSGRKES